MLLPFCRKQGLLPALMLCVACVVTGCVKDDEAGNESSKTSSGQSPPEAVKEAPWEAEKARMEKEIAKLEGEAVAMRVRSESLEKENESLKAKNETLASEAEAKVTALTDKHEVRTGALHWWLAVAVIAGVFLLLGGIGLGSSVRREVRQSKQIDRKGGSHVLEEASE